MCDECNHSPSPVSRRAFLIAGAAAVGAAVAIWQTRAPDGPAPARKTSLAAATKPETASPAITQPAPDLGAEVFPDATGRAIAQVGDAPVIVLPRSDWTSARPNLAQVVLMNGIDKITVHHTAGLTQTDAWSPTASALEEIRDFHTGTQPADRNWADIAYHFAVDRGGRVWQARPLVYQGAHAKGHNEHNIGIVLLGNFDVQTPAAAQLWTLSAFITFLRGLYGVSAKSVFTHGELGQTSCPGKSLQAYMNRFRSRLA